MNGISRILYSDNLPLMERQQVIYRAYVFNKLLLRMWPKIYNSILNREEKCLDYFKLEALVRLSKDDLLKEFFTWLLKTQGIEDAAKECPLHINEELDQQAKSYALNCVSKALSRLGNLSFENEDLK